MYRRIVVFCIICSLCLCGCTSAEYTVYSDAQGTATSTSATDADTEETVYYEFLDIPTDPDETIYTTTTRYNPHITSYLETNIYEPDGIVQFHIVDPTNTGFRTDELLKLWEWNGEDWIPTGLRSKAVGRGHYVASPKAGESLIDTAIPLYLSSYENIQRGKRYKITIGVEGYTLSQEFTVAAE